MKHLNDVELSNVACGDDDKSVEVVYSKLEKNGPTTASVTFERASKNLR